MTELQTGACPRCDVPVAADDRYCTGCGYALRSPVPAPAIAPARPRAPAPEVITCGECGAVNAASRLECARCRTDFETGEAVPEVAASPPTGDEQADAAAPIEREPDRAFRWLALVTAVVAIAVVAVIVMLLSAQGIGLQLGSPEESPQPGEPVALEIADVAASSALPASGTSSYGAANLIDGDPQTAWNEGAEGPGEGEWVEFLLLAPHQITRVLVWNGHQTDALFLGNGRIKTLRIDAGDRMFEVELFDQRGPQAVDLGEPVAAERIRLTIEETYPGERYADAALSEVELFGLPISDAEADQPEG
ncbi:MAG TPA: discoidin domain-containing protein [Egibacteraceae bacterium]|nr:discoidin domain-containing protein [Egibacteraceae bacterium]